MKNKQNHNTSIVGIVGENNTKIHLLANLYYLPLDPEAMLTIIASLEHKPNVKWTTIHSIEQWCTAMDQSVGGTLFVVSMEGELHIFKANQWSVLDLKCPDGLNAVWAANDQEAFVVGLGGERIHIINDKFETSLEPSSPRLNAIHGSSESNVISVGDDGSAFKYNGKKWNKIELPTNANLIAAHCRSENEIYIGGAGVLYRWDGTAWHDIEAQQLNISSIEFYQGRFFVACGQRGIFVVENDELVPFKELTIYRLKTIGASIFGIGNKLVVQYDGQGWWGGDLDM